MSREIWHIADDRTGGPVCGAEDAEGFTLADPENIDDARQHDRLCAACDL